MHGGPIDPDRTRNTYRFDPERPEQRTPVGAVIFVGVLAAGVAAVSYPITTAITIAIGFVAGTAWRIRQVFDRPLSADESLLERNDPETVGERSEALVSR